MAYNIQVHNSDIHFTCDEGLTILEAAKKAGYELPYSCKKGICGSCKGRVISGDVSASGEPDALDETELATGYALFCDAKPCSDVVIAPYSINKIDPNALKQVHAKVYKITRATDDVSLLHLRFPAGTRVPFKAGQYLQIILSDGSVRNYSMANPPHQNDGAHLHIRHVKNGRFSNYLASSAAVGDILELKIPQGVFHLRMSDKPLIFVASGTGFAPIKSILEGMFKGGTPTQPISLYWGARRKKDLYMTELPEKWAKQHANFSFIPVLSEENNGTDRTGFVHEAVMNDFPTLAFHEIYACGAPSMINAARHDFVNKRELPPDAFFCDAFVTGN